MSTLREQLRSVAFLQGEPLPINLLARDISVSPTPVREALAMLAGEGLITRTASGYVGPLHDPASLRDLYDLARILTLAHDAAGGAWPFAAADGLEDGETAPEGGNPALACVLWRVRTRLAPFAAAEALALPGAQAERSRLAHAAAEPQRRRARLIRQFHDRRARASARILAAALGLVDARRI